MINTISKDLSPYQSRTLRGPSPGDDPHGRHAHLFHDRSRQPGDAVAGYGAAAQAGIEKTARDLEEMRRKQASQIVVPGAGGMGGEPGRRKIQMR